MTARNLLSLCLGTATIILSGCSVVQGYSDSEKEALATLTPSKYQPATREARTNIETQELLAQAAFWSREYQLNPADLEASVKLASSVRKMGNPSKAAEITQTSRALYPNDPYLLAEHSAALIALERGQEALKPLDKALHSAPGYARLWSLKGAALDQISKYNEARQHYNRALQITPNDPNIMANMGLSFALAGDPATAEQWLRRAAGHPEAGSGIRQNLDLVLQLQGKPAHFANSAPVPRAPISQARPQARPQVQPQASARPQAAGSYSPFQSPLGSTAHLGHRSNVTVVGNQPGAPRTAAEAARAAASQSQQPRVVVPHQAAPQVQGNILDQISRSVNQKQVQTVPPGAVRGQTPVQGGAYYPQQRTAPQYQRQTQPQIRPQAQQLPRQQQQQGYPSYAPYEAVPQRRGALRRR